MPYPQAFTGSTIKGIWDWLYPTTILWLKTRTNELEDCYLAGMQAFLDKLWANLADEAGLEPKFLQCFQALLCKIREAEETSQDIIMFREETKSL